MDEDTLIIHTDFDFLIKKSICEKYKCILEDTKWIEHYNTLGGKEDEELKKYKEQEDKYLSIIENPIQIEEGIYQCNKCKSKKTFSYQLQTRSADEGMTTFVECANCKTKWRIY